ncbi:3-mercaptopyruvate sulfurtransferase [Tianweitania sp. BSSL-BM11]|uniref:3-mercaptopyruvate sulfurtransferase n=1 Tax=Tianweitania aestuarii TaxID=2814886 RepID=A0ABS5RVQ7_9HYPH|nr:3-mercaptopyruvate sulfurtransferase [Tianweitania aestuarii]MBS9720299.1 3-mercaptopyruvate sulfurtransferase [Tianweitania aestuarii]
MSEQARFFVTPDWLQDNLKTPGVTIVDGSWYLPAQDRDPKAEYEAGHIPGAVFFDHEQVVSPDSDLPHTLPSPEEFARIVGTAGITADDTIIVYDGPGLFTAPRVWWMFRTYGAKDVRILEGGIDGWKTAGRPLTADLTKIAPAVFKVDAHPERIASFEDMMRIVETGERQIADARPAGRFTGNDPEPREGMRSGHMPGARSLPALSLSRDGKLLPADELKAKVESAGIDLQKPVVTSCGSGITAAVLSLALESLGHKDLKLYDGSWSEWGGRSDTPLAKGEA